MKIEGEGLSTTRPTGGFVIMRPMPNDNFNIGTGEGESPIVPNQGGTPSFGVRTMGSDLNAVKTGETPKPYVPSGALIPPPPPAGMATKDMGGGAPSFDLPKMDFNPPTPPVVGAPGSGTSSPSPIPPKKRGGRGVFVGIITVIIIVGLAVLGYFVIYPMFFATPTLQPAPVAENPTPPPVTPTSTEIVPAPTSTASTTPPAVQPHVSLFKTPADASLTATTITTGATLASLNIQTSTAPQLVEVTYQDQTGNPVGFASVMHTVFGLSLNAPALQNTWDDQGTAGFVYVDSSGKEWLGYVTAITSNANLSDIQAAFTQAFESNTSWVGAFATDPGTPGTWKSGSVSGVPTRYLPLSSGASINYAWSGNTLVISTSYNGFKDVLSKL